jgi:hypothetical protein
MLNLTAQGTDVTVPADYLERVYAGVLGKLIGVYLGRPFEGWTALSHQLGSARRWVWKAR